VRAAAASSPLTLLTKRWWQKKKKKLHQSGKNWRKVEKYNVYDGYMYKKNIIFRYNGT